jgi:xanthine dehydrogenase YagS FAD-binding subunit
MEPFAYLKPGSLPAAVTDGARERHAFIAGGTTLVDLLRLGVMRPAAIVDVTQLPLAEIAETPAGGLAIGALVKNADLAADRRIAARYAVVAEALLSGASPQVRNAATTGGNLLQRTRCPYFRDPAVGACNKRAPGSGCAALGGFNRSHAVLGTSPHCIATHPSDLCVALAALDAKVLVTGAAGARTVPMTELHVAPGDHPEREHVLAAGELITGVELPPFAGRSRYVKVRDRASFAFALASAAVTVELDGGTLRAVRIALGGVATKPWRATAAERALAGQRPGRAVFERAAGLALEGAKAQPTNEFKIELARRTIVRALEEVVA